MWHGAAAHLPRDRALLEVAKADIGPHVAVKIEEDGVEARNGIEELWGWGGGGGAVGEGEHHVGPRDHRWLIEIQPRMCEGL